jgi:WD40 repeat protein
MQTYRGFGILTTILFLASYSLAGDQPGHLQVTSPNNPELTRVVTEQPGHTPPFIDPNSSPTPLQPPRDHGRGSLAWSVSDVNAISDHLALSANGEIAAIGYTLNDERLQVHWTRSRDTLWNFRVETGGSYVSVSGNGGVIAYSALDSVWLFRTGERGRPYFRFGMPGFYPGPVALSRDSTLLVCTGTDVNGITNRAWGFRSNGEQLWTLEVDAQESNSWYGATISGDGSVAAVNGKYHLYVVNAVTGERIWDERTYNTETGIGLSQDGSILVTGTLTGRLRVFGRVQDGFTELWHYSFTGASSSWVTACAISEDGSTIAAGTLDFFNDRYEGRMAVFETYGNGNPLWITDPNPDEVSGIDMSSDGGVIAMVTWGDVAHERPDLMVYERFNRAPFFRLTTGGSLTGVSISDDGSKLFVGGKATHSRVFGRGGQAHLIELELLGGMVTGIVSTAGNRPVIGAIVSTPDNPYRAVTNRGGSYRLRVQTDARISIPVDVRKPGYQYGHLENVDVRPGFETSGVNFVLDTAEHPPVNLRASQGSRNQISLVWDAYNGRLAPSEEPRDGILAVVGDQASPQGLTPWDMGRSSAPSEPFRDRADDADSIRIYRSPVPGANHSLLATVPGGAVRYIDRNLTIPQHRYHYVITADFGDGESAYSDEAVGWVADSFLVWEADLRAMPHVPLLDGIIVEAEWEGAAARDISDVMGYDLPDSAGTVYARIGFNDATDSLYLAIDYIGRASLQENMGMAVYVDDDGNGAWSWNRPGSEGNYWGYYRNGGSDMRFRSLSGGQFTADPYYRFENPPLTFNDRAGHVQIEMAIPLGFHTEREIALFAPDYAVGLGLFAMQRSQDGLPIFNGWWPQDMFSIVTEPRQFARVRIPAEITAPPQPPSEVTVERRDRWMFLDWTDPVNAEDSARIRRWDGVNIYRNGEFLTQVATGRGEHLDRDFIGGEAEWGGWFEYQLSGFVLEDQVPFEGPLTRSIGAYRGEDPDVIEFQFDDGTPEGFYVVSFEGEENRFATRFDIEAGMERASVFWIDYYHRGNQPINLYCALDDGGDPSGEGVRFTMRPSEAEGLQRFHVPGRAQPTFDIDPDFGGAIWVILEYLDDSPGAPAIGVDAGTVDDSRNRYHTAATGWRGFVIGQPIIRAAIGQPVNESPDDDTSLPREFRVLNCFPNPFNSVTVIPVELPSAAGLKWELFDLSGRSVRSRSYGMVKAGRYNLHLDAGNLGSGLYIVKVSAGGLERRKLVTLIR